MRNVNSLQARFGGFVVLAACLGAALAVSSVQAAEAVKRINGAGKIVVGTEAALPPFEFIKDGKTVGCGKDTGLRHLTRILHERAKRGRVDA